MAVTPFQVRRPERLFGCAGACRHAFLLCPGPSLAEVDLAPLRRPGIVTMGFNRTPYVFRTWAYTMVDKWTTFAKSVWADPTIVKFVRVRERGLIDRLPGVVYTEWGQHLEPGAFFAGPRVPQSFAGDPFNGVSMIAALSLLARLGARRVTLVGADFHMTRDRVYCVPTTPRTPEQVERANRLFRSIERSLARLRSVWAECGFELANATPGSRLSREVARPVVLADAADRALADFPDPATEWAWLNTEVDGGQAE